MHSKLPAIAEHMAIEFDTTKSMTDVCHNASIPFPEVSPDIIFGMWFVLNAFIERGNNGRN